jgi:hypothetical protein
MRHQEPKVLTICEMFKAEENEVFLSDVCLNSQQLSVDRLPLHQGKRRERGSSNRYDLLIPLITEIWLYRSRNLTNSTIV